MKKFKPLEWKKDNYGDREYAEIKVNFPVIYSKVSVQTDISGKWIVNFFGCEGLFNAKHTGLNTIKFAKELAENHYQEKMNKLYNEIEKMIDN